MAGTPIDFGDIQQVPTPGQKWKSPRHVYFGPKDHESGMMQDEPVYEHQEFPRMLYQLHELQRQWLNPLTSFAETAASLYSHPSSPLAYMPFSRELSAGYDLLHRVGKLYDKPHFGITHTQIKGKHVPVVEETVVDKPFCRLLHFKRTGKFSERPY